MHLSRRACRLREFTAAGVHRAVGRSRRAIGTFRGPRLAQFRPRASAARRSIDDDRDLRRHQAGKSLNNECIAGLPHQFHIAMQHEGS